MDRCDQSKRIRLNRRFPALEDVQLRDCCFSEVVLNAELTPSVRSLVVENLNDDVARLQLACPKMHQMRLLYYGAPRDGPVDFGAVLDEALRTATQLMTFESYKLWSNDELTFAKNFLRAIDLKRADNLHELTLWAPRLDQLCLEGCYTLGEIHFQTRHTHPAHPLRDCLDYEVSMGAGGGLSAHSRGYAGPPTLRVNRINANLGEQALASLRAHGRVPDYDLGEGAPPLGRLGARQHAGHDRRPDRVHRFPEAAGLLREGHCDNAEPSP